MEAVKFGKKSVRIMVVLTLLALSLLLFSRKTYADEGFDMYTLSPGINITAGNSVSYELYITGGNAAGKDVKLSIESMPDGFTGYFKNGGYEVTKVHSDGKSDSPAATFQISVPSEAKNGSNTVVLKAATDDGLEDKLRLELNISELQSGDSNFNVEYPDQEGVTGTVFSYSSTIVNNSLSKQNYNFSTNAPTGWTVSYTSGDKQISSLDVESGESAGVSIKITPPDNIEAGDYKISCSATSAKESLSTDLNVKILGTYSLEVTTVDGNLAVDAYADKPSELSLLIKNTGNIDLKNIILSSQSNSNWDVSFDSATIDSLEAGASKEVKASITPSSDSIVGDYITNIVASCDNNTSSTQLRVTVKTQTGWGIFAVVIIIIIGAGFVYVLRKYGRR